MKKFGEYFAMRENDEMPSSPNMMNPNANQMPPTGNSPQQQYPGQGPVNPPAEAAAEMEGISNDIQREVEKLFKVINRHNLNKKQAVELLTTMIHNVANAGKLSNSFVKRASNQGMATNSAGISPPLQPMANG
jgi:hypothetical protein